MAQLEGMDEDFSHLFSPDEGELPGEKREDVVVRRPSLHQAPFTLSLLSTGNWSVWENPFTF